MCVSIVVVTIGLIDHLMQHYRYYTLRQEAKEAAARFVSCFKESTLINESSL
jgi:hypothetical protein